jgi:hypothetical protein
MEKEQLSKDEIARLVAVGITHERERIIKYLIEKEVLRESMLGRGWVAVHHSEGHGIDLNSQLGGN